MPEAPVLSPELIRQSVLLTRALAAAVRNWALYPPEHPAVDASIGRLAEALTVSMNGVAFTFAVTPQTLLVAGVPLPEEPPVVEAARLLHDRDILQITFLGDVPLPALQSLLRVLTTDVDALRASGGPAPAWDAMGHASIAIEQIDYEKLLEDREVERPVEHRDDIWRSLVSAIVEGRAIFDERQQQRLLEIAGNAGQIGELATEVAAPKRGADGSPLITTQAATVLAVFRHLTAIVQVMDPQRLPEVMRNVAAATSTLDPHVVLQMMQSEESLQEAPIVDRIAAAFDDEKVAHLLAAAIARDGKASDRLAQVFGTIAPDVERKQRVLTMTRSFLSEHDYGKGGQFKAAWASMEGLLLNYDEKPYVSDSYQAALAGAGARADMLAARDLPPELPEWLDTLGQDSVRSLSVLLITDLLRIEQHPGRAGEIARDLAALGEDLLMSGAFEDTLLVTKTLKQAADAPKTVAPAECRAALASLGSSAAMRDAATLLGDLEERSLKTFTECCKAMGPSVIDGLRSAFESEDENTAYARAVDIVRGFGAAGVPYFAAFADDPSWFVQRNAANLLGTTRSADAVAPLQTLLRKHDERVLRAAISALAGIDDPAAARAVQTMLRAATGSNRHAVISALVKGRDPRVVPMLARLLNETDPFGDDHQVVLDTLDAVRQLADERAVAAVAELMKKKRFFQRAKALAFKTASVQALRAIGTARARQALDEASRSGDRLLRKVVGRAS